MADSLAEPLSWKGYSARRVMSLELGVPELCKRSELYGNLPMFDASLNYLERFDPVVLQAMQKVLLDRTGHSSGIIMYFGLMDSQKAQWLQEQVGLCVESLMYFARTFQLQGTQGQIFDKLANELERDRSVRLQSVLSTSKYNYPLHKPDAGWTQLADYYPLYLDTGVDLMCNGDEFIFSEAQIRYNAPRPFLMTALKSACIDLCRDFFEKNNVQGDDFEQTRLKMLEECFQKFAGGSSNTAKVLIDAWTYENFGANNRELAKVFGADYILFDDIYRKGNPYHNKYSRFEKLFVLNHPPLNLLCPDSSFLDPINNEHLEEYDDLAWNELFDDHMQGRVFLTNPMCTDILNDKAIYEFLPDFSRKFLGKEISLPVVRSKELWDYDNPRQVNEENLAWVLENQAEAVIAHRYLEGGMGIRVGKWCDRQEWKSFVDTFVRARPYLFIVRPYYAMSPDCSVRLLACGLVEPSASAWSPQLKVSTDMFGRVSPGSHVTSESARCFLVAARQ